MKDKERKKAIEILGALPQNKKTRKLREEFERKGFLSKKEMKILANLASTLLQQASA